MGQQPSVLIVGAGPTGLTLACDLARRGAACRIIDKAPAAYVGSRGKGLQPRTLEVFDDLGVIEAALASGGMYPEFRAYIWRFTFRWDMFRRSAPTPETPYPNTLLLPQWRTEEILGERLAQFGVSVERATELIGFEQDDDGVTAVLAHEGATEHVRVRYLVGADGGHSFVRKALGVGFEGATYKSERILVGDAHVEGLSHDYWHAWPRSKGGAVTLCPLPNTDLFQLTARLAPAGAVPDLTEEGLQTFFEQATGRQDITLSAPSWLSVYQPTFRMVSRYRIGRVFLAGDAAHVHPPEGGQGLNTGVQDAYNLGWKLGQTLAGAPDALLDSYEAERAPVAAHVLGMTATLHRQASRNDRKQRRDAQTQQLTLTYRGSPLARDLPHNAAGELRAGDRAPDAPCLGATGTPMRLFDAFRGPHFTLLAFGSSCGALVAAANERYSPLLHAYVVAHPGESTDQTILVDVKGDARRAYAAITDGIALIRPDGYLGLVSHQPAIEQVADYLCLVAGAPANTPRR